MRAEEIRTLKQVTVYSPRDIETHWTIEKDYDTGDYALVKIGNIIAAWARTFPNTGTAGKLVSAWNSMYRNKWSNRLVNDNVALKEMPIGAVATTALHNAYTGKLKKADFNGKYKAQVLSSSDVNDYVTALYYQAQMYKNPMERFVQALEHILGSRQIVAELINPYANHKAMEKINAFNVELFDDGKHTDKENMLRTLVMVKTIDDTSKSIRMVPVVACKWADVAHLYKAQGIEKQSTNSATTTAGCFRHIYKIGKAKDICWFE